MTFRLERVTQEPPVELGPWGEAGVAHRAGLWEPELRRGGAVFGAFDDERLVGFAIVGPRLDDYCADLAAMFVDSDHRRGGSGTALMQAVEEEAWSRGVRALTVYSNPTESSVRFYLKCGFRVISVVDKSRATHLPWDVVLLRELDVARPGSGRS